MAFDTRLLDLMGDTVTLALTSGVDRFGKRTLATPVSVQCHVEYKQVAVQLPDGRDVTTSGRVYCAGIVTGVDTHTQITLPGGETPICLLAQTLHDEGGAFATVLYFGKG